MPKRSAKNTPARAPRRGRRLRRRPERLRGGCPHARHAGVRPAATGSATLSSGFTTVIFRVHHAQGANAVRLAATAALHTLHIFPIWESARPHAQTVQTDTELRTRFLLDARKALRRKKLRLTLSPAHSSSTTAALSSSRLVYHVTRFDTK